MEPTRSQKEALATKTQLIARARRIIHLQDLHLAWSEMDKIKDEWAQSGHAGEKQPELTEEIRSIWRELYNRTQRVNQTNANRKEHIISQIAGLRGARDLGDAKNRVLQLRDEFFQVGYSGRDNEDRLRTRLDRATDDFFDYWRRCIADDYRQQLNEQKRKIRETEARIRKAEADGAAIASWSLPPVRSRKRNAAVQRQADALRRNNEWRSKQQQLLYKQQDWYRHLQRKIDEYSRRR